MGPIFLHTRAKIRKILKNTFLNTYPLNSGIKISFWKIIWLKQCALLTSTLVQKIKTILKAIFRKRTKKQKKNSFGPDIYLFPYNPGLRIFSEKQSGSNDGPYWPLHSRKKLGRLAVLEKIQRNITRLDKLQTEWLTGLSLETSGWVQKKGTQKKWHDLNKETIKLKIPLI